MIKFFVGMINSFKEERIKKKAAALRVNKIQVLERRLADLSASIWRSADLCPSGNENAKRWLIDSEDARERFKGWCSKYLQLTEPPNNFNREQNREVAHLGRCIAAHQRAVTQSLHLISLKARISVCKT